MVHDAGSDHLRDVASDRGGDIADRGPSPRDTAPEVFVDSPVRIDGGIDGGVDAPGWPVVPGCVTGRAPSPRTSLAFNSLPLIVGCGFLSRTVATVYDDAGQGFLFSAAFDPPLQGFELDTPGMVCNNGVGAPIIVTAPDFSTRRPGSSASVSVRITVQGPRPQVLPLQFPVYVVRTDFVLANEMLDFGLVPVGTSRSIDLVMTNSPTSPAIQTLYPRVVGDSPFTFNSRAGDPPVEPGQTGTLLTASFYTNTVGSFLIQLTVSPFADPSADPACGSVHNLTAKAQTYMPRSGGPIP